MTKMIERDQGLEIDIHFNHGDNQLDLKNSSNKVFNYASGHHKESSSFPSPSPTPPPSIGAVNSEQLSITGSSNAVKDTKVLSKGWAVVKENELPKPLLDLKLGS